MAAHGFGVREGGRVEANVVRSRRGLRLLVSVLALLARLS